MKLQCIPWKIIMNTSICVYVIRFIIQEGPSDEDSAVSSAPASLSPQPLNEMWVSIV